MGLWCIGTLVGPRCLYAKRLNYSRIRKHQKIISNVFNPYIISVLCGVITVSFLLSYDLPLYAAGEKTSGTECDLSLNVNKEVFQDGDSVIIYGNSPRNAKLVAAMLPVSDEHLYTKADVFESQGCHYSYVLDTFSNDKPGYYWVAIAEADNTEEKQGDPNDVKVIFYAAKL